jgi:hypothetical protein
MIALGPEHHIHEGRAAAHFLALCLGHTAADSDHHGPALAPCRLLEGAQAA